MYNRLFTKILDSSIWLEPDSTRIVWLTLIASMDEDGFCPFACAANLANRALVPLDKTEQAIKTLEDPDPNSADPENEGRRIERVPGGWIVLNAAKYRAMATREVIRENNRKRVRAFRDRKRGNAAVTPRNASVTPRNVSSRKQSKAKHEQEQETPCDSDESQADPRHAPVRALIQTEHLRRFRVVCPWDGSEAKALALLLGGNPAWSEEQIASMVRNRFLSDDINSARPRKWLPNISEYAAGPLDRYGRLASGQNGKGSAYANRAERRQSENLAALDSAFPLDSRAAHGAG